MTISTLSAVRPDRPDQIEISAGDTALMAVACGFAVATLYYNQPLLPLIGDSFGQSAANTGWIATLTQLGYAAGLILFVPLGDRLDRRKLIAALLAFNMTSLLAMTVAPNFPLALGASFAVGMSTVTAQVIIPAISGMTTAERRGRVVGSLLSGLSAGMLLARTLSGVVGARWGWRTMFGLALLLDLMLLVIVLARLPRSAGTSQLPYRALLASMAGLCREKPVLRAACLTGFLMFAAFSALWATLASLLARPPYEFGSDRAGAFGFVGIAGILASPLLGRAVDRFGSARVLAVGSSVVALAFLAVADAPNHLLGLLLAMIAMDIANRSGLIANQNRVYALSMEARSRLNTVFMTSYFLGGASGAQLAAQAVGRYGWIGLAVTGGSLALAALTAHLVTIRRLARLTV